MSETRTFACNLCEALCGLSVTVENNRPIEVRGDPLDPFSRGHVCPKGPALRELFEDPDRLRTPMRRLPGGGHRFEAIGWDEALEEAANRLGAVRAAHGKNAIGYYVGNPTAHSLRASLGSQVLQMALGTHNRFDPNSQDSNPRLFACMEMYGDGLAMPVPDIDRTELLVILGGNPAASGGSQMSLGDVRGRMRGIRERGGRVILIDPRRTETARSFADEHHFIRPGGDAALLLALLHVVFTEERVDEAAIALTTSGLDRLRAASLPYSPERVGPAIGISPSVIRVLARTIATTPRAVVYARVGVCQSEFGPVASWLVEALNVVTGHFDREGGAMFPEPAADVGPLARLLVGNHFARWRSRVRGLPEFLGSLPSAAMAEEMETKGPGQIRALVCFAGNPVLSTPDGERLARALPGLDYMVAIDLYLNETSRHAQLVLPPTHIFETGNYDVLLLGLAVRNLARFSAPILTPPPGARDDWEILSELAIRLAAHGSPTVQRALRRLARDLPERALALLLRLGRHRIRLADLRAAPHGFDLGPLRPARARKVRTQGGRVRLAPASLVADLPRLERWLTEGRGEGLVLIGRRHLRGNNSWMHNLPSLVKGPDRSRLLMHPSDAAPRGLCDGDLVKVSSGTGGVTTRLTLTDDIMPGVVSLPHGYGHQTASDTLHVAGALAGASANALTDTLRIEPILGTSILGGFPVTVASVAHETRSGSVFSVEK